MLLHDKMGFRGKLEIILRDQYGNIKDYQVIHNLFTEVGDAFVADQISSAPDEVPMSHMAIGTGATGTAASTTLTTEIARVALTSFAQGTGANDNDVTFTALFPA